MDDERELEVIKSEMEQTRSSLADKLETLEGKVLGTVEGATQAVSNTVEAVQNTVSTVKESLDVRKHVRENPWAWFAGAVAAGFAGGYLLGGSRREKADEVAATMATASAPVSTPAPAYQASHNGHRNGAARPQEEAEEPSPIQEGLKVLGGLAVGTLMGLLREAVTNAIPREWAPDVTKMVDDWTTRLGGKPLEPGESEGATHHDERDSAEMGRSMGTARW